MSSPVTVTGKLVDSSGNPLTGTVSFLLSWDCWLADNTAEIVQSKRIDVSTAADGTYSVLLYPNVDLLPASSSWIVTEHYNGQKDAPYSIVVPHGGGAISTMVVSSPALPAQYIFQTETFTVASQAAMLALPAHQGDIAIRTDAHLSFILSANPATVLANWVQLSDPQGLVESVNGQTGAVTLPTDPVAGTAGLRTLGTGAQQAAQGSALAAETTRATGAEATLTTNLAAETTRAEAAEAANAGNIATNTTAITAETTRATAAEATKATTTALTAETSRAAAAETANASAITAEASTARAAEGANATAITTEQTRATGAETTLTANLNAEVTRAEAAEGANATAITNEATTARAAEAARELLANKGAANGYAGLDAGSRLADANLPADVARTAGKTTAGAAALLPYYHVDDYGAVPNALQASDGVVSAGTLNTFSSVLAGTFGGFQASHVGAYIRIGGAGLAGANLVTTIASVVNSTTVTLSTPASTPVASAFWVAGTDSTAAIKAAVNAAGGGINGVLGGTALMKGRYLISAPITWAQVATTQLGLPAPSLVGLGASGRIGDNADIGASALICAPYPTWPNIGYYALDWTSANTGTAGPLLGPTFENFDVVCNSQAAGVRIAGARKGRIRNVNVDHAATPAPAVAFIGSTGAICFAQNGNNNGAYDNIIDGCSVNAAGQDGIVMRDNSEGSIRSSFVIAAGRYNFLIGSSCKGYDLETTESGQADLWISSAGAHVHGLHFFPAGSQYGPSQSNIIISADTGAFGGSALLSGLGIEGTVSTGLTTQQAAMIQLVPGSGTMNAVISGVNFQAASHTSCFIWADATVTGQVTISGDNYNGTPTVAPYVFNGATFTFNAPQRTAGLLLSPEALLVPTGWKVETFSRGRCTANTGNLASGRLQMQAVSLPAGLTVSKIGFVTGTIALASGLHQWFALFDASENLLAVTSDDTSTAWAASSLKSLSIATTAAGAATSFTTTYTGVYYVGVMVQATTVPNIMGCTLGTTNFSILPPIYEGHCGSALTTPPSFPYTAPAIGTDGHPLYALLG